MRTRSISAIGIVLVSLLPALFGGWVFALAMALIMSLAWTELLPLLSIDGQQTRVLGWAIIGIAAVATWWWTDGRGVPLALALTLLVPLGLTLLASEKNAPLNNWAVTTGALLYVTLPVIAAISLRQYPGAAPSEWFDDLATTFPQGRSTSLGLGLFLLALLVTWMSDTFAYLVGRTFGRTKLIPRISPNKTIEGAVGGLIAGAGTAALCAWGFGLTISVPKAILLGILLTMAGMIGDLTESQIKRRAGAKDSGHRIPGHGGFLDRVDALIWVLIATWVAVPWLIGG